MADTYPVLLRGGPCNNRTIRLGAGQLSSRMTSCGGQVYRYAPDTSNPWIFQLATDQERGVPVGLAYDPRALFSAWNRLMKTLGYTVPAEVTRARAAIARMRRAVR